MAVRRQLGVADFLNITLDEVVEKVEKLCTSLSMQLGDKKYFYGDEYVLNVYIVKSRY